MARSENNLRAVLQDTADAIRGKTGSQEAICPRDFADEIEAIPVGITPSGTFSITDNGEYNITEYAYVNVEVEGGETLEENHIYQYTSEYGLVDQYANDRGNYTFYENELRLNDTSSDGVYYFNWNNMPELKSLESYHTYYYNGGSDFSDMGELDPGIYSIYDHYASEIDLDESKLYRPFIGSGPEELREEEWYNDMLELEVGGSVSFTVEDSSGNQYSFTATRTA